MLRDGARVFLNVFLCITYWEQDAPALSPVGDIGNKGHPTVLVGLHSFMMARVNVFT